MYKSLIIFVLFIKGIVFLNAQGDTVYNQIDSKGLKQGFWKKSYQNGILMYRGCFKDDKPVGTMIRYYDDGHVQAVMKFSSDGKYAIVRLFYQDGELSAEGKYVGTLKDSTWKYYSYYSGALISEETYNKGKKNGITRAYYDNGKIAEEIEYKDDIKSGVWNQYFEDGKPKLNTSHVNNEVNGLYTFYYPNGNKMILGSFLNNKRNGTWTFFKEDGNEKYKLHYDKGNLNEEDEKKLVEQDAEFFKKIDDNIGKFEEPKPEDFFRGPN